MSPAHPHKHLIGHPRSVRPMTGNLKHTRVTVSLSSFITMANANPAPGGTGPMSTYPAHLHSHSWNLLPSPSWGTEDNDNPKAQGQGYTLLRGSLNRATRRLGGCFYGPACHPEHTGDGQRHPPAASPTVSNMRSRPALDMTAATGHLWLLST